MADDDVTDDLTPLLIDEFRGIHRALRDAAPLERAARHGSSHPDPTEILDDYATAIHARFDPVKAEVEGARQGWGSIDARMDNYGTRIGTAEGNISSVTAEVVGARQGFASIDARMDNYGTRIGTAEGNISAEASARASGDTSTLNSAKAYTDTKTANTATSSQIGALQDQITVLTYRLNQLRNYVDSIHGGGSPPVWT